MSDDRPADVVIRAQPRRMRSLASGIVILLCGGIIGSVGTALLLRQPPDPPRLTPDKIVADMQKKYQITDDQKGKLLVIFKDHIAKFEEIRKDVRPRVDAEHDALKLAVKGVLNPDQAKQWETDYDNRFHRYRQQRSGDSGGSTK